MKGCPPVLDEAFEELMGVSQGDVLAKQSHDPVLQEDLHLKVQLLKLLRDLWKEMSYEFL